LKTGAARLRMGPAGILLILSVDVKRRRMRTFQTLTCAAVAAPTCSSSALAWGWSFSIAWACARPSRCGAACSVCGGARRGVLYAGMAVSLAAIVREVPRRHRAWSAVGLLAAFPLAIDARNHARWMVRQAWRNPAWWNRAFIETHARVEQEV
jgi:hypothetical protein